MATASSSSELGPEYNEDESMSHSSEIPEHITVRKIPRKRKKSKKDPNAPMQARTAYVHFLLEKQAEFRKADTVQQPVSEITRRVAAAWQSITPEEREIYDLKASESKAQYAKDMAAYMKTDSYRKFKAKMQKGKDNLDSSPEEPVRKQMKHVRNDTPSSSDGPSSKATNGVRGRGRPRKDGDLPHQKKAREVVMVNQFPLPKMPSKNSALTELRIPIMTKEFQDWSVKREKDLRQVRQWTHELEVDVAGLQTQNEHEAKIGDTVASTKKKLEAALTTRKEVIKILLAEFAGIRLPSGMTISQDTVEDFMMELERVCQTSSRQSTELDAKVRALAPKFQPYMAYLQ